MKLINLFHKNNRSEEGLDALKHSSINHESTPAETTQHFYRVLFIGLFCIAAVTFAICGAIFVVTNIFADTHNTSTPAQLSPVFRTSSDDFRDYITFIGKSETSTADDTVLHGTTEETLSCYITTFSDSTNYIISEINPGEVTYNPCDNTVHTTNCGSFDNAFSSAREPIPVVPYEEPTNTGIVAEPG